MGVATSIVGGATSIVGWLPVLWVGLADVDLAVPVQKLDISLQLFHVCLESLLVGPFGSCVRHQAQSLVLVV